MLTPALGPLAQHLFLTVAGGDHLRADEMRSRAAGMFSSFIMISYVPLTTAVVALAVCQAHPIDQIALADELTAVEAYAVAYVDTYLQDPANSAGITQFYDGDVPASALAPGGHALRAASCLPGVVVDGYRTYSVLVDADIPQASHAAAMTAIKLQVDISADHHNRLRAITLPHARPARPPGRGVQLATQIAVSPDRPVFMTVTGFLGALLIRQGELAPFVAADTTLAPEPAGLYTALSVERVQVTDEAGAAQDVPAHADGVQVTARVVVQTASGVALPMDFPLVMSVAGGHWLVDRIDDAPSILAPAVTDSPPTTTPSPTTTAGPHPLGRTPEGHS